MSRSIKIIFGLLFFASGLYASEEDSKKASAVALQTWEQRKQADELSDAIDCENIEKVWRLLAAKADVNGVTTWGNPVIHYARTPEIMQLLLDYKADVRGINRYKKTALHKQCSCMSGALGRPEVERIKNCTLLLLQHGADINVCDDEGNTLLTCYLNSSIPSDDYIALLLEHGADPMIANLKGDTVLDVLRSKLQHADYESLRISFACENILTLAAHRKRVDVIDETLAPIIFSPLISIIASYDCGNRPADKVKVDALLQEFKELFDTLRAEKRLS